MFKKLKDKIAEEVKQSPLKFQTSVQQLTQAVSSSTNNSYNSEIMAEDEDEDDEETNDLSLSSSEYDTSFTTIDLRSPTPSKNRRSSASTINSDLFPIYEFPPSRYNMQSDLESNSEFDDGSSIQQFGNVSKENLYQKYRTVLQKYHKYHGRFVDLQKYCQELQREYNKAKTILTETQDKAIRRIAELREQCTLEQKAKAHLEDALRNELEERDHIIDTMNTKITLLKMGKDCEQIDQGKAASNMLSKVDSKTVNQTDELNSISEIDCLRDKIKNFELLLSKAKDALTLKKTQIEDLQKTIESNKNELKLSNDRIIDLQNNMDLMKKKEEEALLSLAENKFIIHKELEAKESQIKSLEDKLEENEKEMKKLKMKLESEKNSNSETGTENILRDDDIKTLQKELNHLKLLRNNDQIALQEKDHLINEFKTSIDYSNQELIKFKNEIKALNFLNKPVDSEIMNLHQELVDHQSTIKKLELSLSNKEKEFGMFCAKKDSEIYRLDALLKSQADNIVKLQQELLTCRSELTEKIKINVSLNEQIKTLNDALEQTKATLSHKSEDLKLSTDAFNRLEAELLSVNCKFKDISKEKKLWEETENHLKADKIVLEETMKNVRNELNSAQVELKNFESKMEKYEEEIKINREIITEKRILEEKLAEAEAQLKLIKAQREHKQKVEQEMHVQTANYLEEINSLKSKEDDYLSEIRKLKTNVVMLQNVNENAKNMDMKLKENMEAYNRSCEQNKTLKEEKDSLENEIIALKNEISKLQELLRNQKQVHAENDALKVEQEKWKKKVEELQTSCESYFKENEILKIDIRKLQVAINEMEALSKEQKAEQTEDVFKENERKLLELNECLSKENESLRVECEKLKQFQGNVIPMQEENVSLKTEMKKFQEFLDEISTCRQRNVRLQRENDTLQINLQEMQSKLVEMQDSFQVLAQEREFIENNFRTSEGLKNETERKIELLTNELLGFQAAAEKSQNENKVYIKMFDDMKLFIDEIKPVFEHCCYYKEKIRFLENLNEKIIREKSEFLKEVSNLRSKNTLLIDENKVLCEEILNLKTLVQDVNMVDGLVNFKHQISYLKKEYKLLKSDLNSHLHKLKQHCNDFKMDVNNGTRTMIQKNLKLYTELENRFKSLENEYEVLNNENGLLKNEKQTLFNKTEQLSNKLRELEEQVPHNRDKEIKLMKDKFSEEIKEIITGYEMRLSEKDNEYEELQNKLFIRNDRENTVAQQETKEIIQTLQEDLRSSQDLCEELTEKYGNETQYLENSANTCECSEVLRAQVKILSNELRNCNCKKKNWKDVDLDVKKDSDISLEDCAEIEYLRNILFQYMMGHQPVVLAKVLAAVVKFDNKQTKQVLQKEEQKQSLLGQLGFS